MMTSPGTKTKSKSSSMRIEILILALLVLFLAQSLSSLLGVLSFQKEYRQSFIAGNRVVASVFPQKLEGAVRYGKSIEKYYGMDDLTSSLQESNPGFLNFEVFMPDGSIVHSLDQQRKGMKVPDEWLEKQLVTDPKGLPVLVYQVRNMGGKPIAFAAVTLDDGPLQAKVLEQMRQQLLLALMVMAGAAAALILAMRIFSPLGKDGQVSSRRLLVTVLSVIVLSQVAYMTVGVQTMRDNFLEIVSEDVGNVTANFQQDLVSLLNKGLEIKGLFGMDQMMRKVMENAPSVQAMVLADEQHQVIVSVDREDAIQDRRGSLLGGMLVSRQIDVSVPVYRLEEDGSKRIAGYIKTAVSGGFLRQQVQEFLFNAITVLIVSMLFITEIMLFFLIYVRERLVALSGSVGESRSHEFIRTAMSVFLFGFMMSVSFVPLRMQQLAGNHHDSFSPEILSSMPVSAEMFCGLLAVLLAGVWCDRRGWHQPFLSGVVISAVACWWSGMTNDPWSFVASRGLAGCGYGLAWMSAQSFVFDNANKSSRARSLAGLAAGVMTGYLSGNVIGAMLADRIGFELVFKFSAGLILFVLPLVLIFMRSQMKTPVLRTNRSDRHPGWMAGLRFFLDRRVLMIMICCVIPLAISQVGLVAYAAPVCLKIMNVSQANIGRAIMLFGLTLVYVGPWVSRYINGPERAARFLVVAGLLGGGGLLMFFLKPDFPGFLIAILLAGLACSFGLSAQTIVVQSLPVVEDLGSGIAVSMERVAAKLGQMLGPLLMGALFANMPIADGLGLMGAVFVILALCFALAQGLRRPAIAVTGKQN